MRLSQVMTSNVVTIEKWAAVSVARWLMHKNDIRHLVVVDGGDVLGIVSDRDVRTPNVPGRSGEWFESTAVSVVMSSPVLTMPPTATVQQAANKMRGRKIGCVAVIDEDTLVGIVTDTDLLEALSRVGVKSYRT